jgi:tetratricopeptide (TPR) repeat protein
MNKKAVLAGIMVFVAACAGSTKQDAQRVSFTFQAQLDSGNAAYRRGDYKTATEYYHQAAESEPENLSGWYGVYMAETKLGNTKEAAKAKAFVAEKAPEMPLTEHPTASDQRGGGMTAPQNPHVPQGDDPHAALPIDSIRAAKEKK